MVSFSLSKASVFFIGESCPGSSISIPAPPARSTPLPQTQFLKSKSICHSQVTRAWCWELSHILLPFTIAKIRFLSCVGGERPKIGCDRETVHLLSDHWTRDSGSGAWWEDRPQPLRWNLRPLCSAPCALFGFICCCLPTKQHPHLPIPSLPGEQATSPCLSHPQFSKGVEAWLTAADPKTLAVALFCGDITTRVSPRIWGLQI